MKSIAVRELGPSGLDSGLSQKYGYEEKHRYVGWVFSISLQIMYWNRPLLEVSAVCASDGPQEAHFFHHQQHRLENKYTCK